MIDIRQLKVFLAVWENKSFSKASKTVHLTQPTVSGHIKTLEDTLGLRLFDRSGRSVIPTRAGEILYPYAREAVRIIENALDEIEAFKGADTGKISLGGSNIPGQYILPSLLGAFKALRPKVEVVLKIGDTLNIANMVLSRELDVGMVGARLPIKHLEFSPCFEDRIVMISGPDTHTIDTEDVSLDQLSELPFIVREEGSGTRLTTERALSKAGFDPKRLRIIAEMGSTEAVKQAVKNGIGCALVSERAVRDEVKMGILRAHKIEHIDIIRKFYLVFDKRRTISPSAQALIDFIQGAARLKPKT